MIAGVKAAGTLASFATGAALELRGTAGLVASAIAIIAGLATIAGVLFGVRYKVAAEAGRLLNETLEERLRVVAHERDELQKKLEDSTAALVETRQTIARLEALPNLERVLTLISETFERMRDRLDEMHKENKTNAATHADRVIAEIRRAA